VAAWERENMSSALLTAGGQAGVSNQLCPTAAAPVPATVPAAQKIQPNPADWQLAGWACLRFSVETPVYYQYNYTAVNPNNPASAAFTATATGDLDGDTSVFSNWAYNGQILAGSPGVMRLAPTMVEPANPEE
jgi:hypothetical protein